MIAIGHGQRRNALPVGRSPAGIVSGDLRAVCGIDTVNGGASRFVVS